MSNEFIYFSSTMQGRMIREIENIEEFNEVKAKVPVHKGFGHIKFIENNMSADNNESGFVIKNNVIAMCLENMSASQIDDLMVKFEIFVKSDIEERFSDWFDDIYFNVDMWTWLENVA